MALHHPTVTSWRGYFVDERGGSYDKCAMNFDCLVIDSGTIRGTGEDSVGKFELNGTKSGSKIRFAKRYIGAHTVIYSGALRDIPDGQELQGEWHLEDYPDEVGTFALTRSYELERQREAAFRMVVARMKMFVGLVRFFFEDVGFSIVQAMFLTTHQTSPKMFYFTLLSLAAGLVMSLAGPVSEFNASRKLERDAGALANPPPSVDGGTGGNLASTKAGNEPRSGKGRESEAVDEEESCARELEAVESDYDRRRNEAQALLGGEYLTGNIDYVDILMERPDVPAEIPDVAVTDIIVTSRGIHVALLLSMVAFWTFVLCVPFLFPITCGHGAPAKAHLAFLSLAFGLVFVQLYVAILTKYGYLIFVHAPQNLAFNVVLSIIGSFDAYSDIVFVAAARDCGSWLWKPAACIYLLGVVLAQAVPGIAMLALKMNLPAALKLTEMNVLLSLLKPSVG